MPVQLGEVSWRPEHHPSLSHTPPEFIVSVDPEVYPKWCADPDATPLISVVGSYEIFINRHGSRSGRWERPSKQLLSDTFGTEDEAAAIEEVLHKGQLRPMNNDDAIRRDRMYRV